MCHEELYDDELLQYGGLEFPHINYDNHNGRPYRYFYSCGFGAVFADSLLKMDVRTKELKVPIRQRPFRDTRCQIGAWCYHIKEIPSAVSPGLRGSGLRVAPLTIKPLTAKWDAHVIFPA